MVRPAAGEPPLDDVNWFARPVPNAKGDWIVAVASHNLNYLYNLTTGVRVRIPDKSDAVATPDGRYITVPSHYTAANTVSFYDAATLLERLAAGRDAADVQAPPTSTATPTSTTSTTSRWACCRRRPAAAARRPSTG